MCVCVTSCRVVWVATWFPRFHKQQRPRPNKKMPSVITSNTVRNAPLYLCHPFPLIIYAQRLTQRWMKVSYYYLFSRFHFFFLVFLFFASPISDQFHFHHFQYVFFFSFERMRWWEENIFLFYFVLLSTDLKKKKKMMTDWDETS